MPPHHRSYAELETLLAARERELGEARGALAGAQDVLRAINEGRDDPQAVLDAIVARTSRLLDGSVRLQLRLDGQTRGVAQHWAADAPPLGGRAPDASLASPSAPMPATLGTASGRAMAERRSIVVEDMQAVIASEFPDLAAIYAARGWQQNQRSVVVSPLLSRGQAIGALTVLRYELRPFAPHEVSLLETFADQAVIAIENARLFSELQERLEEQTAAAEVLATISHAPTNLQRVLDTITESATRLCGGVAANIIYGTSDDLRLRAHTGAISASTPLGERITVGPNAPVHLVYATGEVFHSVDVRHDERLGASYRRASEEVGRAAVLMVPLAVQGEVRGTLGVIRREPQGYTDRQIALLQTFADQAVIAIENARLFRELNDSNASLTEALEQQTATSDVLRAISQSPTDLERVLNAVTETAARLCGAADANIWRLEDGALRRIAGYGDLPGPPLGTLVTLTRASVPGRAVIDGRPVHVPDLAAASEEEFGDSRARQLPFAVRTVLATPLLRAGVPIGTFGIRRTEVAPFTEAQVKLLESFADQAVIAIENARLFSELQERNAALGEALERQTATAEVLQAISRAPTDLRQVLDTIAASAVRLCGALSAAMWQRQGDTMRFAGAAGPDVDHLVGAVEPVRWESVPGRAMLERRVFHIPDIQAAADEFPHSATSPVNRAFGIRTFLAVPLVHGDEAIGAISLIRREVAPFSDSHVALVSMFADQAAIAIENARLFSELQERLEEQTATGAILRVISESPADLRPALDAICASAARLCGAPDVMLALFEDGSCRITAGCGPLPKPLLDSGRTLALDDHTVFGRIAASGARLHSSDVGAESGLSEAQRGFYDRSGIKALLGVPLKRRGETVGALVLRSTEPMLFTERQVALLETFADQAVIAVENARLFLELRQRTEQLTRSVERLTALFEVAQAVGGTLDLQRVLDAVVARASDLAGADGGAVYEYDGAGAFDLRATHRMDAEVVAAMREARVDLGSDSVLGQAGNTRQPVQMADILTEEHDRPTLRALKAAGYRAVLAVPLLRENDVVGALVVRRKTPGVFDPDTVTLLQTFATQSALAIQNARLFQELAVKSQQLEEASRHKSEFLANMSHELRTPLNAIIGFTEVLLEQYFGPVNEKQGEYLRDVLSSGQHLLALINDILDLAKVEAGRMELEPTTFALGPVLESGLVMVKERASRHSIQLGLEVDPDLGRLEADERKVKQVVFNLLTNAVKFTPDGGRVDVRAWRVHGQVHVSVRDTGVGVAPEDQARIFEEFQQVRGPVPGKVEGTGLGLPLCRRFVELHGGRIWVESDVGQGSTFTFALPVEGRCPAS